VPTSLKHTDPTYLRSIFDGLLSGAVHKDNASALPLGLVGMYEEALPPAVNVNERKKFLDFFAVWALLKREVSAEFVAPLLEGRSEGQIIDYIAQYSRWFNSPSGGTYVLYHERLRAFVLQKISHGQFMACNEAIINQCRVSLQAKAGDEWERYALEHLGSHLLIQAMESKDATALKVIAYDTAHWNRQVEISKGFEWSKRMLNDMMLWASKYDSDEVIECALNKVDLHHLEQNDAPRIVELVAQNDLETALQRIEAFGGNDKEGLQRKFILYMLCLMELCLGSTILTPANRERAQVILNHMKRQYRSTKYVKIDWSCMLPEALIMELISYCQGLELDFQIIHELTSGWDDEWLDYYGHIPTEERIQLTQIIGRFEVREQLGEVSGFDSTIVKIKNILQELNHSNGTDEVNNYGGHGNEVTDTNKLINKWKQLVKEGRIDEIISELGEMEPDFRLPLLMHFCLVEEPSSINFLTDLAVATFNEMRLFHQHCMLNEFSCFIASQSKEPIRIILDRIIFSNVFEGSYYHKPINQRPHDKLFKYVLTRIWFKDKDLVRRLLINVLDRDFSKIDCMDLSNSLFKDWPIQTVFDKKLTPALKVDGRMFPYLIGHRCAESSNFLLLLSAWNCTELSEHKHDIASGFCNGYHSDCAIELKKIIYLFQLYPNHLRSLLAFHN
jgi:hypothetical protein